MYLEILRNFFQALVLYGRGFVGLIVALPLILKTVYVWGQVMRDRQYRDTVSKMKEILEKNKDFK